MNVAIKFFNVLTVLSFLYLGGLGVANGEISVGNLIAYYSLLLVFSNSMNVLFQEFKQVNFAYASQIRINDMMSYDEDRRFRQDIILTPTDYAKPAIICKEVSFYYNINNPPTIKNVSLEIKPGQHVAFVGSTGSGKSTLSKLLCALYTLSKGEIVVYDKLLTDFNSVELAALFSYVSQDISLFSGTLYENITLWEKSISIAAVNEAVRIACLDDFMEKRGLQGRVDAYGSNFSGGERQRIDIARALVQNTPIMILDEATSALDIQTENILISNLRTLDKTIIFVAHRLSTIKHCDQIFVMNNGSIIESGNHKDLLQHSQTYLSLINNDRSLLVGEV